MVTVRTGKTKSTIMSKNKQVIGLIFTEQRCPAVIFVDIYTVYSHIPGFKLEHVPEDFNIFISNQ